MPVIPSRRCGSAGELVPALSLGSWFTWERSAFEDIVTILSKARDAGALSFDVALYRKDFMGPGKGPEFDSTTDLVLARALQVAGIRRDDYRLAIKGWFPPTESKSLTAQVDELLLRLGSDYADALIVESIDYPENFDLSSIVGEIAEIVRSGKIRHWAVNNWSAAEVRAAIGESERNGIDGPQFGQMKYGLVHRAVVEGEPFTELTHETGFSVQASRVLAGGLLSGTGEQRHTGGTSDMLHLAARSIAPRVAEIASSFGASSAQYAIAFALTNPAVSDVLLGIRTPQQFDEAVAAFELLDRFSSDELRAPADEFWLDRGLIDPTSGGGPGSELVSDR